MGADARSEGNGAGQDERSAQLPFESDQDYTQRLEALETVAGICELATWPVESQAMVFRITQNWNMAATLVPVLRAVAAADLTNQQRRIATELLVQTGPYKLTSDIEGGTEEVGRILALAATFDT